MSKTGEQEANGGYIAIAHILRAQGRRGEVLAELLTDQLEQFQSGRMVRLLMAGQTHALPTDRVLEDHWLPVGKNAGRIVLKLAATDDISQAESLAGMDIAVPEADLPKLDDDTFYVKDLLGCVLLDREREVGKIVDVEFVTSTDGKMRLEDATPLLAVQPSHASDLEPVLVPFARAYLVRVDLSAKQVVMDLPPGLFDLREYGEGPAPATT